MFIDGIPQLESPKSIEKPSEFQVVPKVPNFDKEAKDAIKYEGLQPLAPAKQVQDAIFLNVRKYYEREKATGQIRSQQLEGTGVVVVVDGKVVCKGSAMQCARYRAEDIAIEQIDLCGGVLAPGLLTYGGNIGLAEIEAEASTNDGIIYDPLEKDIPRVIGNEPLIRAIDGLQFRGRNALCVFLRYHIYRSHLPTAWLIATVLRRRLQLQCTTVLLAGSALHST